MTQDVALDALKNCYERLLEACDMLELIADGLPGSVPLALCNRLVVSLVRLVTETHVQENQVLLPMLLASERAEMRQAAERLRQEHDYDDQVAIEVEEALVDLVSGRSVLSPDATGYLLRSFFESIRRHVYAEMDLLSLIVNVAPRGGHLH